MHGTPVANERMRAATHEGTKDIKRESRWARKATAHGAPYAADERGHQLERGARHASDQRQRR